MIKSCDSTSNQRHHKKNIRTKALPEKKNSEKEQNFPADCEDSSENRCHRAEEKFNQHSIITFKKCNQAMATTQEADGAEISPGRDGQAAGGHRQQEDVKQELGE